MIQDGIRTYRYLSGSITVYRNITVKFPFNSQSIQPTVYDIGWGDSRKKSEKRPGICTAGAAQARA